MIPLTSQQRLQHRLGIDLNDYAELDIHLDAPCASTVSERLGQLISELPTRYAQLQRASKYSSQPAIRAMTVGEEGDGAPATIAIIGSLEHSLTIRFAPLLWDIFSVLRLVEASLDGRGPLQTASFQCQSSQLLQNENAVSSTRIASSFESPIALASPKSYGGTAGVYNHFQIIPIEGRDAPIIAGMREMVAQRCFHSGELIHEVPIATDLGSTAGNLSYFVSSLGEDELTAHIPLADRPGVVAAAVGFTELTSVPGVGGVTFRGASHGMATQFVAYRSQTELHVSAAYLADRFEEPESLRHFRDVVGAVARGASTRPAIAARTAEVETRSIAEILLAALSRQSDSIAVQTPDRAHSRRQLLDLAHAIAARIPGTPERIGICCANSFEYVGAVVGCILRGVCYVPLDRNAGSARLRDIVESARLDIILCMPEAASEIRELGAASLCIDPDPAMQAQPAAYERTSLPIYRIYTSGTTGKPKPVDVSDANLRALFASYSDISAEIYRTIWGFTSSIGFDASVKQYLGPLLYGGTVFVPSASLTQDPIRVLRELKTHQVDVLNLTPQLLRVAVNTDLCDFRFVLVSGDTLPPQLVEDFHKRSGPSARLINLYGPTETTINAMAYSLARDVRYRSVPIGRALGGCRVEVQDTAGQQQPYCVQGSLKIFGDIVTDGHRHAGGDKFGWRDGLPSFDTGDNCFVWYDDLVYFVGRSDRQIKVNGVRVNLEEVTNWIRDYLGVGTCYVGTLGSRQYAVLLRGELADVGDDRIASLADVSRFGRSRITPIVVDEIPVDVNGKVDLAALLASQNRTGIKHAAPAQNLLELEILAVLHSALERRGPGSLDVSQLGVNDNFFEHGLDSLLTMEVALDLTNRFNVDLSPGELTAHPTSRKIADLLGRLNRRPSPLIQVAGLPEQPRLVILLPPVLGSSLIFTAMIEALGQDNLVAACNYPIATDGAPSVEQIANAVTDELRRRDLLRHRIDVVGYSMGGSVGFELCKQIACEGRAVELYILDKPVKPRGDLREQQCAGEALLDRFISTRPVSDGLKEQLSGIMQGNIETVFGYTPSGSISVPTHLFVCTQEEKPVSADEWAPYLRGELTIAEIDCRHHDILLPPHVGSVLACLATNQAMSSQRMLQTQSAAE